jgi:hypothetical protein
VLGAEASSKDPKLGTLDASDEGAPGALLALLAILLALAAAIALASRKGIVVPAFLQGGGVRRSSKPVLFLGIEGVIAVRQRPGASPTGELHRFGYLKAHVPEHVPERVRTLASRYEIVWATVWGNRANRYFSPLLGLEDDLPVLSFRSNGRSASVAEQIDAVDEVAGRGPIAWVLDNSTSRHERWASSRRAPTLLVETDPSAGISEAVVTRLIEWADALEPASAGRFARGRRTSDALAGS